MLPALPRVLSIFVLLLLFLIAGMYSAADALAKTLVWGLDQQQTLNLGDGNGALLWTHDHASGESHFFQYDGNGNVVGLSDASGVQTAEYRYGVFGELVEKRGSDADANLYRFSTKPFEEVGGLYYYGYRYLSAAQGRWLSQDPLGEAGGLNLYGMVGNNPVDSIDFLGLLTERQAIAVDTLFGGAMFGAAGGFSEVVVENAAAIHTVLSDDGCGKNPLAWQMISSREEYLNHTAWGAFGGMVTAGVLKGGGVLLKRPLTAIAKATNPYISKVGGIVSPLIKRFLSKGARAEAKALEETAVAAAKGGEAFFEGAKYSPKVLQQMNKADDVLHAFPQSVDGFATKYGQWTTKTGADGKAYQWLEMRGSYGDKTGTFEFIKDSNGVINHRYLKPD